MFSYPVVASVFQEHTSAIFLNSSMSALATESSEKVSARCLGDFGTQKNKKKKSPPNVPQTSRLCSVIPSIYKICTVFTKEKG